MKLCIVTLFLPAIMLSGCVFNENYEKGNGNIISEKVSPEHFSSLNIGGNYEINLVKDVNEALTITTDENLHQYISTSVANDELMINSAYTLRPTDKIKVEISYKKLDRIIAGGASSIVNDDVLIADELEIVMEGAGALKLDIDVKILDMSISGAGMVKLTGFADDQQVKLSGAGAYKAEGLTSNTCKINISGIGGAEVYVEEALDATITGLGDIKYFGDPSKIVRNITGMGKINRGVDTIGSENGV